MLCIININKPLTHVIVGPSMPREVGNRRLDFGSWHSVASTSITICFQPHRETELSTGVCFSHRLQWQTEETCRERQGQQLVHMCECLTPNPQPTPRRQPQLPLNILSPLEAFFFFSLWFVGIMTPCPLQHLKDPMVSNSAH